jgi:hypothetical protein
MILTISIKEVFPFDIPLNTSVSFLQIYEFSLRFIVVQDQFQFTFKVSILNTLVST